MATTVKSNKKSKTGTKDSTSMRSVRRCFQMMEYFDSARTPMSATDLSRELDAPLSSMIDLLKCVSDLGYIAYDSRTRTYHPTTRIALLGEWLSNNPLDQTNYLELMEELHQQSKETISLFWQNDVEMKCLNSMHGTHSISFILPPGESVALFGTAVGHALLAKFTNAEIKKAYIRYERQPSDIEIHPLDFYMQSIDQAQADGYAKGYRLVIPEVGAIAMAAPASNNRWIVFSIAGLAQRVEGNEDKLVNLLTKTLAA